MGNSESVDGAEVRSGYKCEAGGIIPMSISFLLFEHLLYFGEVGVGAAFLGPAAAPFSPDV